MSAITSYTDLQASILAWMDDATLASCIPEMIGLAKGMFNDRLESPQGVYA